MLYSTPMKSLVSAVHSLWSPYAQIAVAAVLVAFILLQKNRRPNGPEPFGGSDNWSTAYHTRRGLEKVASLQGPSSQASFLPCFHWDQPYLIGSNQSQKEKSLAQGQTESITPPNANYREPIATIPRTGIPPQMDRSAFVAFQALFGYGKSLLFGVGSPCPRHSPRHGL